MAKASAKSTPFTRLPLKEAYARVLEVLEAPHFTKQTLIQWVADRKVRWGSKGISGRILVPPGKTQREAAGIAQRGLWSGPTIQPQLNCAESSVFKATIQMDDGECTGFTVYGVWLAAEDIEAQLGQLAPPKPAPELKTSPPPTTTTAATPPTPKAAARLEPLQWLAWSVVRFPEQKNEGRAAYFERLAGKMQKELKARARKAVWIGRQLYALNILPRRQSRTKSSGENSH
jgi:hypothetical protein